MKRTTNLQNICVFVIVSLFLSLGKVGQAQLEPPKQEELTKAKFIKNRIIIKFKSEGDQAVEQEIEPVIKNKQSLRDLLRDKSDSLDKLNKKFKVRQARGIFRREKSLSIAEEKLNRGLDRKKIRARFQARSQRVKDTTEADLTNVYILEVEEGQDIDQMMKEYQADPHVEFVQPDYIMEANYVPNDPYYANGNLWGLKKIQLPTAWDKSQGEGVVVAVVDTGVDYHHPDLAANIWRNVGEIPDNKIDDDRNGYIDDVRGFDFTTCLRYDNSTCVSKVKDNDPMDVYGHGTHVAGTIGAVGNNNQGVIGVAPRVKIMPLKGLTDSGQGSISGLAEAIVYAAHNGADVISNSWGCTNCPVNVLAENAVREAVSLGALVVFSAGNSNVDVMTTSPANMKEVISVSATDAADNRASFSNFGAMIGAAAPGVNITSTYPGNRYVSLSGTSMAAPHVAGEAALIVSRHPEFSNEQVRQVLRGSLDQMDYFLRYPYFGPGRINAATALDYNSALNVNITDPSHNKTVKTDNYVVIRGNANGPDFKNYQLFYKLDQANQSWIPLEGAIARPVSNNILGTMDARNLTLGKYMLRLDVTTTTGQYFNDVLNFTLEGGDKPPILTPIGNQTATVNQPLRIEISVNDPNSADTIYIFAEYPNGNFGGSFVDNRNRTAIFTWTPAANQVGNFKVKFTANDGRTIVSELVTINVSGPAVQVTKMVENGDFNPVLGKSNWSGWGSRVILATNMGYNAPNSAKLVAGSFDRDIYHSLINVTTGKTYHLTYALKSTLTLGAANVTIEWRTSSGFFISSQVVKVLTTAQGWMVSAHDVTAPPKAAKIKIIFKTLKKSAGEVWVDDVNLQ